MSNIHNEIFLEDAKQRFDEALGTGYFVGAAEVIDELMDKGFTKEAYILKAEFKATTGKVDAEEGETF